MPQLVAASVRDFPSKTKAKANMRRAEPTSGACDAAARNSAAV
jgi:hypothetical protein